MKYFLLFFLILGAHTHVRSQESRITTAKVRFTFVSKGVSGSISGFSSESSIVWDKVQHTRFEGKVKTETLSTGNFLRDWHLKSGKYFDENRFPSISFKSDRIEKTGENLLVFGTLTLKGISNPLEIQFRKSGNTLTGTATLYTPDFDITIIKKNREANKVLLTLELQLE